MSHSTEIKVEIGLDSYHLHCGSRHPADDGALFRSRGKQIPVRGRHRLAQSGGGPLHIIPGKFNINCPRAMTVDLVTGVRRKVTVIVWPANPAFLEVTDTEGNVMHFHAETGLDIYRGNTALVNWSES